MENSVFSGHLFNIEIDDVKQGVVKATNPSPQTIELDLARFEVLKDGKPHQIRLTEMPASEWAAAKKDMEVSGE
ncbi:MULTISPECIES: hypothetical protein [Eubacteriales]|uniref:hypothetical protein n=1 Tax=Eubacteriales TaxID=186802 RepID=UPI001D060CD2|nr:MULTISPECIES: hypothetical protein [Eubacteriales]MCB7039930.1 hypothetical protein [Flavonifractor plautii]MCB7049812.1 hypothetical protein [Intestinimonas butyriciproducens]